MASYKGVGRILCDAEDTRELKEAMKGADKDA